MKKEAMEKMRSCMIILMLLFIFCLPNSCGNQPSGYDTEYVYTVPEQTGDGWDVAALEEVGLDESPIAAFINELVNNLDHRIHSILVVKNSKLVFEEYFPGIAFYHGAYTEFDRETRHNLASVTKSVTSALIGLAIRHGFITDENRNVFDFFPEYASLRNAEKDRITIKHLLTMTSGLQWDEDTYPYTDPRNDCAQLFNQDDPLRYVLGMPMESEPGAQFLYNSGTVNVLGEIIRKASGMRADDFAERFLFNTLGITDFWWQELANDICYTSGDLKLRPRDMAKFGCLYLRNGNWKGEQVLPAQWIQNSIRDYISQSPDYGYLWWISAPEVDNVSIPVFSAVGWGGQRIAVIQDLDMVVVVTAGYYDEYEKEALHVDGMLMRSFLASAL
jgi:CubicO group peptidase (beta-lactamase class C family)